MKRVLPAVAAFLGLGVVGGIAFLVSTRRMVIEGHSMEPAFSPGDRVLVNRLAFVRSKPRPGDVVVILRSRESSLDIKRIAAGPGDEVEASGGRRTLGHDEWWLLGDNPDDSSDSRQLGPVRTGDIAGKVMFKY